MRIIYFLILLVSIFSCQTESAEVIPDVGHIDMSDFSFVRYDTEVSNMDSSNIEEAYADLMARYPGLTELYFKRLLNLPSENQDTFYNWIDNFKKEKRIVDLQDKIDQVFGDGKSVKKDLLKAASYFKHYFPDKELPRFYTYLTEYGYQCIIFDDITKDGIGIGLDMFLGDAVSYKDIDPTNPAFSDYIVRTYNQDHISKKAFEIIVTDLMGQNRSKRLLDQMLYNGKKLYILNKILPEVSDTVIMEYATEDWDWVNENEMQIWNFFTEENLLYETNHLKVNKYLNVSPHSPGMPKEAPGRTANFIAWKIIDAFMQRHPDYSLQQLIDYKDNQKILELSRYKPKRR